MKTFVFLLALALLLPAGLTAQTRLFPFGSDWKFLDDGTDQKNDWRLATYNDGSWPSGKGKFGYGLSDIISLISFGLDPKKKHPAAYFRKVVNVPDATLFGSYEASVYRDDGLVVYVNGVEVYRNNMPTGDISYKTLAISATDNGSQAQTFKISGKAFKTGSNLVAVEVHQAKLNNGDTDMAFDMTLTGLPPDVTPPVVQSIKRQSPATETTSATSVVFRVTFSELVFGVDASDFTVVTSSGLTAQLTSGAVAAAGKEGREYDVTVSSVLGDGTLRLDLKASGTGIVDEADNAISGGYSIGDTYIIRQDVTPPVVQSIKRQSPASELTNATAVTFRAVFSEGVSGVDKSDFSVMVVVGTFTSVLAPGAVAVVGTDGRTYDITVSSIAGDGILRLDLNASGTGIQDAVGNGITSGFTAGETYTIQQSPQDVMAPVVLSINRQSPASATVTATAVTFRVTFSEKVTGVDKGDFTITRTSGSVSGTLASNAVAPVGTDGETYDVTVSSITGQGELRLDLNGGGTGIKDAAGNLIGTGFTGGETYTIQPLVLLNGFTTVTPLTPLPVAKNTAEKPQSKVWMHAGKHWAVMPDGAGTHIWRLDGTTWTNVFTLASSSSTRADCKVVGDVVHVLLFRGSSTPYLVSAEYVSATNTYKAWTQRTSRSELALDPEAETATLDVDSKGRMWVTYDGTSTVYVQWSDSPYKTWSAPLSLATNIHDDDISAVVALPGKIGVLWSNQNTKRFGFKTHTDGADPANWSSDEVPASQSALDVRYGMADDHLNMAVASDGTLYCAVKTGYDTPGYPKISLLVRRANGTWDGIYEVTDVVGTRGIVLLNEAIGKVRVVYTYSEDGGDILYKESLTSSISFGSQRTLISGLYNNATSIKATFSSEVVILASTGSEAVGVLATDGVAAVSTSSTALATAAPGSGAPVGKPDIIQNELLAYPNPVYSIGTIRFALAEEGEYSLRLYNSKGALVVRISEGSAKAGDLHAVEVDGTHLSRGLYFIRLQTARGAKSLKLTVEK
ncbi:T9SS type A sorting domain-containing protein [Botryobacter ruber]|uniref:T9SS type A sorting domain-containing protein n=1 Tax=Botryobacter ruber TaxID=2171629 RepID=UPI0013E38AF7|nr:T9SS type A sorting domain-containing protein [Botryobacter ruber]